jgi:hypothetical protein
MALYKAKAGKTSELEKLIHEHFPVLKEYGLTTGREPFIGRSKDGTYIEIFEWASEQAAKKAHDHPAVAKIWEAMAMVCSFEKLENLSEAGKPFPSFERAF